MRIVAKISKNFRDIKTTSPKVLLRIDKVQSDNFDRDHTFVPINRELRRVLQKIKGNANYGSLSVKIGSVPADAGQVILLAASTSTNDYAFKIEKTDLDIDAFVGQVTSFKPTVQGNVILSKSVNIGLNSAPINIK